MGNRVLSLCGSPFGTPTAAFFRRRFLHRCPCFSFPKRSLLRIPMCAYPRRSIAQNKSAWEKPGAFPGGKRAVLHTAEVLRDNRNAIIITWGAPLPQPPTIIEKNASQCLFDGGFPALPESRQVEASPWGFGKGRSPFPRKEENRARQHIIRGRSYPARKQKIWEENKNKLTPFRFVPLPFSNN